MSPRSLRRRARLARPWLLGLALVSVAATASASPPRAPKPPFRPLELDGPGHRRFVLLDAFHDAATERPGPVRGYMEGPWGRWRERSWWSLAGASSNDRLPSASPYDAPPARRALDAGPWITGLSDQAAWLDVGFGGAAAEAESEGLDATDASAIGDTADVAGIPGPTLRDLFSSWSARPHAVPEMLEPVARLLETLGRAAAPPLPPRGCWRRPVLFIRYGAESDRFPLVGCDGAVASEALDRLTLMARPPEIPRPGELLPDEPDPEVWSQGEWLRGVRPVHPRLLWLLQTIGDAFPRRAVYVYSGYRPKAAGKGHSLHGEARAMDISIHGVRNEDLFRFCRTLDDVGCGYYPNSKFVHVDVRKPGVGHAFWVDASHPGETSRYVDGWPGVVESGAFVWGRAAASSAPDAGAPDALPEADAAAP